MLLVEEKGSQRNGDQLFKYCQSRIFDSIEELLNGGRIMTGDVKIRFCLNNDDQRLK